MFKVSHSKIKVYGRCKYAYHQKYVLKLRKRKKSANLQRGSVLHECIERWNLGRSWTKPYRKFKKEYDSLFSEEKMLLGDLPQMVFDLMKGYTQHWGEEELDYVSCEQYFKLPLIPGKAEIEGYIDAITQDTKKYKPLETKTYKKLPNLDFLIFNPQSAIYLWASNQMGFNSDTMIWNIIRAKQPTYPKMTEGGKLSLAKIDSLPHVLEREIINLGLNPNTYRKYIDSANPGSYFIRKPILMSKYIVKDVMEDLREITKDMMKQGHKLKAKNLTRDCSWCEFQPICQAELLGLDTKYIKEKDYEKRKEEEGKSKGGNRG